MENIIYNLSNTDYHSSPPYSDYLSSSQLKLYAKSPRAAKFAMDNPTEQTEAMRFGSLFHDLMEWCSRVDGDKEEQIRSWAHCNLAVFEPPINKTTNKPYGVTSNPYKQAYKEFEEKLILYSIVSKEEYEVLIAMGYSLLLNSSATSEQVRKLLKWGKPEVSIFYETEDGIKIKVRPDLLTSKKIVDWKTTTLDDLTEESINRTILRYGYHISAAMYQYVYHAVTGKWLDFYIVFVQKQAPYDCVMVDMANYGYRYLPEADMVMPGPGALEFQRLLALHTRCLKSNEWPGAETFIPGDKYRIMEIEPPRYYQNKFIDEY